MGHHISKQQKRQMSDEHQRMNRTKTHLKPITSANQVKSNSLTQKLKTKKHSKKQSNDAKIDINNTDKTPKYLANNLTKSHECSTGSVVITIRLLKMESNTKDIEKITNMNGLECGNIEKSEKINNNEDDMNSMEMLNATNISNDNKKHLNNNNLCENVDKKLKQSTTFDSLNENSDYLSMFNQNQTNEINNKNSSSSVECNKINSPSENLNCDTISANISSLLDRQELLMPSNSELGVDIMAEKVLNIDSTSTSTSTSISKPTPISTQTSTSQQTAILSDTAISQEILRDFFPSGIISTVSPYPHHIPIANIVKSECNNSDNSQHPAQSHHSKSSGNCCDKQTTTTHKDAKEIKTKKPNWSIKFNCTKVKSSGSSTNTINEANESNSNANATNTNCTNNLKEPTSQAAALVLDKSTVFSTNGGNVFVVTMDQRQLDLARLTPDEYAIDEDCDKKARIQRAIEIAEGVEPPPGFISTKSIKSLHSMTTPNSQLVQNSLNSTNETNGNDAGSKINAQQWHMLCSNLKTLRLLNDFHNLLQTTDEIPQIHSQVDYIHCLVPDLKQITNCSYYWGKMDRYEAERLLENKPEGTFLLRDSAQEEFLFSVSFRKYGRSLHARIEQFNHKFSFDVHDPGVYTANTVTGLLEHYKDPACVMFFEPALTLPLNRKFVYSLQQLCRATIVSHTTYDGINEICLPRKLKSYLKEYHYRQRVKVRRFDESNYGAT